MKYRTSLDIAPGFVGMNERRVLGRTKYIIKTPPWTDSSNKIAALQRRFDALCKVRFIEENQKVNDLRGANL